ncbi:hypothetical protein CHARACLAT_027287 [Characodon lateralis]|uniref:Uncharacterized protein n=1 Tax=Characodon lateralis TaxID=208331 RepID=A0ABU7E5E0_9TELE|nr:hypothetical protein [Characodon lateralis]
MANGQQCSTRSTHFTSLSNRRIFHLLLAGFNSTWNESRCFIYGKPNNGVDVPREPVWRVPPPSSVCITVAFSGTSVFHEVLPLLRENEIGHSLPFPARLHIQGKQCTVGVYHPSINAFPSGSLGFVPATFQLVEDLLLKP